MLFLLVLLAFLVFSAYFECYSSPTEILSGELPFQIENSGFYVVLNNQFCSHSIYSMFSVSFKKVLNTKLDPSWRWNCNPFVNVREESTFLFKFWVIERIEIVKQYFTLFAVVYSCVSTVRKHVKTSGLSYTSVFGTTVAVWLTIVLFNWPYWQLPYHYSDKFQVASSKVQLERNIQTGIISAYPQNKLFIMLSWFFSFGKVGVSSDGLVLF